MKIEWRWYNPDTDRDAVLALHAQMEERIGRKLDLPELDRRPVIGCVVGLTDGVITHGVFAEAEVEICAVGCNPLPASEARGAEKLLLNSLNYYDIRIARSFVPTMLLQKSKRGRASAIARLLEGMNFVQEGAEMTQFFRWLITTDKDAYLG